MQKNQQEWFDQWSHFQDDSLALFTEWIAPRKLDDFRGKRVLDAGCGRGDYLKKVAPFASQVVGVDSKTADTARRKTQEFSNVVVQEGDIALFQDDKPFDAVYCMGAIQRTDDPAKTFRNLKNLTKKGGVLMIRSASYEGNFFNRAVLERLRRTVFLKLPKPVLKIASFIITLFFYPVAYSIFLLPLKNQLPFYGYFQNFRRLSFFYNKQNVHDKMTAPSTFFMKKKDLEAWFNHQEFSDIHITHYKGVSWRSSGIKK